MIARAREISKFCTVIINLLPAARNMPILWTTAKKNTIDAYISPINSGANRLQFPSIIYYLQVLFYFSSILLNRVSVMFYVDIKEIKWRPKWNTTSLLFFCLLFLVSFKTRTRCLWRRSCAKKKLCNVQQWSVFVLRGSLRSSRIHNCPVFDLLMKSLLRLANKTDH